jgi:putative endonuclease
MQQQSNFITYIVKCADGTLYTGWTNDIERRIIAHNSGTGAKYTRNRAPVSLVASWSFDSKVEAMRKEYAIKKLPRTEKLKLAKEQSNLA